MIEKFITLFYKTFYMMFNEFLEWFYCGVFAFKSGKICKRIMCEFRKDSGGHNGICMGADPKRDWPFVCNIRTLKEKYPKSKAGK